MTLDMTLHNMIPSSSLTLSCHFYLSPLFVNIHTHDGRFVFHYSRIYFHISSHRSFLYMFDDNFVHKSRVCILVNKYKFFLAWPLIQVDLSDRKKTYWFYFNLFLFLFFFCLLNRSTWFSIMEIYDKILPCFGKLLTWI